MRLIATADWQLGMTAHYLDDEARPRYLQARLDAVRRVGELARESGAAFVVVGGAVFEHNQLDRAIVARTFEALRGFGVPVVLVPGNHDPLDSSSIYDSAPFANGKPDHVHVLRDSAPFEVVPGVEVVGAPWFSKRPTTDLVAQAYAALDPAPAGIIRVIAGHGAVSTLNPDRDSLATIDVARLSEALGRGLAHVAILGDRHSTHEVAPRIWYPGTPEVTDRGEIDPGNALVIDVADNGEVDVTREAIGTWRFDVIEPSLNSRSDVDSFAHTLAGMADKDRTVLWLAPRGTLSTSAKAVLDDSVDAARDLFAGITYWDRHTDLAVVPDDHDFSDLELSGFARDALTELKETATGSDDEAAGTALDALGLLYRLAGGHR